MEQQNSFWGNTYTAAEWTCIKITIIPLVVLVAIYSIWHFQFNAILQENICSYINCTYMVKTPVNYILTAAILLAATLYIFEKMMLIATGLLTLLSLLVFSYTESLGIKGEYGLFTVIFAAQFVAYLIHYIKPGFNLKYNRVQFSLQLLAAAYVLSGIAKFSYGGIYWAENNAPNFAAQIYREYYSAYATTGNIFYAAKGAMYSGWLVEHIWILKLLLALTVILETGAILLITGKRNAFIYGSVLLLLHIGIYITMNIVLLTIVVTLLALTINPVYRFVQLAAKAKQLV